MDDVLAILGQTKPGKDGNSNKRKGGKVDFKGKTKKHDKRRRTLEDEIDESSSESEASANYETDDSFMQEQNKCLLPSPADSGSKRNAAKKAQK